MSIVRESILTDTLSYLSTIADKVMTSTAKTAAAVGFGALVLASSAIPNIAHAGNNDAGIAQALSAGVSLLQMSNPNTTWKDVQTAQAVGQITGGLTNGSNKPAAQVVGTLVTVGYQHMQGNNNQPVQPNNGYYGQPQPVYQQPVYNQPVYQQQYPQRTNYQTYNGQTASPMVAQIQQQLNNNQQNFTNAGFQQYGNPEQQRVQILAQTGRLVAEAMNIPGAYEVAYNHPFVQQVQGTKHFQDGFNQTRQELQRTMQSAQPSALPTGYSR